MSEPKNLFRVFRVAGREFCIYHEYYEEMGKSYPEYPDFVSQPEYTEEGYAFAHYVQEGCKYGAARDGSPGSPENCGMCRWFQVGKAGYSHWRVFERNHEIHRHRKYEEERR